jgi:HK97 family phage portal protein
MVKDGAGKRQAEEHPMFRAMHDEPNPEISARSFKSTLTAHCMLGGDSFAKIIRRSGTGVAMELWPLMPEKVKIDRERTGQKRLTYSVLNEFGGKDGDYPVTRGKPQDILHIRGLSWDGIHGINTLKTGRQSIGTALATERHVSSVWRMGGRKPFWLERKFKFENEEAFKAWRADLKQVSSDPTNNLIFDDGTLLHEIGTTLKEAQALESRQWTVSELSRWWGISPHLIGDLSRATFANIEQLFLEFKTITMADWASQWQDDWNRCVLTPDEKGKYFLHFNLNAFLIGDFAARMAGYATAKQNGWLNADEIRDLEDRNPLPDGAGEAYTIQQNMGTVPGTGEPMPSEQKPPPAAPPKLPASKALTLPVNGNPSRSKTKEVLDEILAALRS